MARATTAPAEPATGPIATASLLGHATAERAFLDTVAAGRMPHAWLLSGPKGIGKMTLAYRMARYLLSGGGSGGDLFGGPESLQMDPAHALFRRIIVGGCGDLRVIERGISPRTKKLSSEIVVDQVRGLGRFFSLTSAENGWRIAIIDGAEEMNASTANALLKLLEEPPQNCLLLLVSHAPGRLLPTIRSRCRQLALRPLGEADTMAVLAQQLPELEDGQRQSLARLAEGSPGRAMALADAGGVQAYDELIALVRDLPELDFTKVHALGDRLARANNEAAYRVWIDLLRLWLSRLARGGAGVQPLRDAAAGETDLASRLTAAVGLDRWVELWEKIGGLAMRAEQVNLDRKQVVLNAFMALQNTARH